LNNKNDKVPVLLEKDENIKHNMKLAMKRKIFLPTAVP
jgi:hypothetical protein